MNSLIAYIEWLLGKFHQNNIHAITREDFIELERLYLAARQHGDDKEWAIAEFVESMDSPRGDAADKRRTASLAMLRKKHNDILIEKEARLRDGRSIQP